MNKRSDEAVRWNNLILNDAKEDVVKEIYYFARVLNLLIHFELGNESLLSSLLLSTPKYLKKRRTVYATEKALFRLLGKLLNAPDKGERRALLSAFSGELTILAQQAGERRVFNYLDLRLWDAD